MCVIFSRTLEERAQRLFSTKGLKSLDPSLLAKSKPGKASKEKEQMRQKDIAGLESQVYKYVASFEYSEHNFAYFMLHILD